ncbi:ROK family protein [Nocardia sp. CDC160]|uniref:ROK family protein n=1 Tax=Nocardia sp. CDC160 TaxID=3112166 RepID=UPI002DBCDE52|nr:ROK family protein [Nocardia sp. CDC160]MEC3915770.1 ROK family protein [Nocardia sp. CDC160]
MLADAATDLVLAVDVGGGTTKGEITDADGMVLCTSTIETPYGESAFDAIEALGIELLDGLPAEQRGRVSRAAVILPGLVDPERSIAVFSANLGWRNVKVGSRFANRWGMPVLIDHDVTVAGWAEWRFGAGRGVDDVCVLIIGTGISGTLSVGGRLVRASSGQVGLAQAGEYGHIPVRYRDGLPCPCGNVGCVETVASGPAIARAYAARTGREIPGADVVFAAMDTDPRARAVVDDAVDALAAGLLGVVHASCPELVVLGGGLARAGTVLSEALHARLGELLRVAPVPRVVLGEFGIRAGLIGAAHLARAGSLL